MALNTTSTVNSGTGSLATKPQAFYDKVLLEVRRQRSFYHTKLAQLRPMPKRTGDTIQFRKIGKLNVATTPLTEGVTPSSDNASLTAISVSGKQYGAFMEFTDVVDFQMVDDILKEYAVEQGHQANETLDVLTRDELSAGSQVFYANARTSRATLVTGDKPTLKDFRKIVLAMKKNHIRPALNGKYVAIISPEVAFDLLDDPDFIKIMDYGNTNKPLLENEIGTAFGITFVEQVNAKVFAASGGGTTPANVHASIVLGNQAYGITKIEGEGDIKTIVKALGSAGTLDPLNQKQSMGWKVNSFAVKRLDELAIARYEAVPTQA